MFLVTLFTSRIPYQPFYQALVGEVTTEMCVCVCVCLCVYVCRDLRQEVTVLAQLSHPNIVALLGVCFHPMCMVLELAPMGSLFGILDKKIERIKSAQADFASNILRMPGGVLQHELSMRIALQVIWWHGNANMSMN